MGGGVAIEARGGLSTQSPHVYWQALGGRALEAISTASDTSGPDTTKKRCRPQAGVVKNQRSPGTLQEGGGGLLRPISNFGIPMLSS